MDTPTPATITQMLREAQGGHASAAEALLNLAYGELGGLARAHLAAERGDHTLQPTALVHEAWVKLAGHLEHARDRRHFFAIASQAMRRVLTDHARGKGRQKRGGDRERVVLDTSVASIGDGAFDLVDLDDSLRRLAQLNGRHARVVELRVFGGLTIEETAEVVGVSHTTIENDWFTAKAWLRKELGRTS